MRAMYAARPALHGNVDALGWHAYAPRVEGLLDGIRDLRATLELEGEPEIGVRPEGGFLDPPRTFRRGCSA